MSDPDGNYVSSPSLIYSKQRVQLPHYKDQVQQQQVADESSSRFGTAATPSKTPVKKGRPNAPATNDDIYPSTQTTVAVVSAIPVSDNYQIPSAATAPRWSRNTPAVPQFEVLSLPLPHSSHNQFEDAADEEFGITSHVQPNGKKRVLYWLVGISLALAIVVAVVVVVVMTSSSSSNENVAGATNSVITEPPAVSSPPVMTPEPTLLPTVPATVEPWSLHTTNIYEYHLWDTPVGENGCISFEVQADHDAHVGFFTDYQDTLSLPPDEITPGFYEIVIGGWNDTLSVVRDGGQGINYDITNGTWLDGNTFTPFWACAKNNVVSVGEQGIAGRNVIACHFFSDVQREIQYVGFSTGFGSDGDWTNIRIAEDPGLFSC